NEMSALTIKWLQCGWWWFWLDPSDLFQRTLGLGRRKTEDKRLGTSDDFHANKRRRAQHFLSHNERQQQLPRRDS
ncbi:hypothetical protein KR067_008399, partial [Drosophila pandora]